MASNFTQPPITHSVEQALAQTLAQWQQWQCAMPLQTQPTIARALNSGKSNHSFLTSAPQPCVIRIDGQSPQKRGLQRQVEWRALESAYTAGLAPAPVYFNPTLGCMVCAYLQPDLLPDKTTDTDDHRDLTATGKLLREIHALPARRHRLDLKKRIDQYLTQLKAVPNDYQAGLIALASDIVAAVDSVKDCDGRLVLCHNDLLRENRIRHAGKLYAIDWEYAAMGSGLYDIAVVIEGDELDEHAAVRLMNSYLQRTPSTIELETINQYRLIYFYIETLWYCLNDADLSDELWCLDRLAQLTGKFDDRRNL